MLAVVLFIITVATTSLRHMTLGIIFNTDGNRPGLNASFSWTPWASVVTTAFAYSTQGEVFRIKLQNRTVEIVYPGQGWLLEQHESEMRVLVGEVTGSHRCHVICERNEREVGLDLVGLEKELCLWFKIMSHFSSSVALCSLWLVWWGPTERRGNGLGSWGLHPFSSISLVLQKNNPFHGIGVSDADYRVRIVDYQ